MRRAFLVIASAAVLVAAAAVFVTVRGLTQPSPIEITSSTVVQGHVLDASGRAADGVEVVAQLWPANDVERKEGEPLPLHTVGTTRTDEDGRFAFQLDPATVPNGFRNENEEVAWVQLGVMATSGQRLLASWELPAFTTARWVTPDHDGAEPAWALRTDQGDLPPSRVDVALVLNGQSEVRIIEP
ncbi:hypothetical protein [Micromonospora coerulea]|uniref:hypothetical protein n=1 Tax=Micromonospora coerulea TaxID=47856 RepID=UPI0019066324|nr:hypothetical protein [Micromonospora veneta]